MFARLAQGKTLNESTVRGWVQKAEGAKNTSKEGVRSFQSVGTGRDLYGSVFQNLKVTSFPIKGSYNVAKWVTKVTRAHPAVVSIGWKRWNPGTNGWEDDGGHAILAVNVHNNNVIFLDPGIGIVEIPVASLPVYSVTYPGAGSLSQGYMEEMRKT
jgi:Papain fold toxin 1, glutamine deamidase